MGKIEFWTHRECCAYRRIFGIRRGPEYLYQLMDVLPKQTICEMRALQVYKFTFNNDFVMNRELNFSLIRNDFGHVLICLWVTLFLRVSCWRPVVEIDFSSINFNKLLKVVSFSASMKMHCSWCITILEYTSQSIKFEKFIIIHQNAKSLRRKSLTPLQKQPPEVFYK